MCQPSSSAPSRAAGVLIELCSDFADHLLERVAALAAQHVSENVRSLAPEISHTDLAAEVLRSYGTATHAVIEWDYFDIDYRSEFSYVHETVFARALPQAVRLHLFRSALTSLRGDIHRTVGRLRRDYLGYTIVRPQTPGSIGRTISPPMRSPVPLTLEFATRVRTVVPESVNLFGWDLSCVGVPFMEQDGHLMRCAHVSAWICHYSAALIGVVPRQPTAAFHDAERPLRQGRHYPSEGLGLIILGQILGNVGLPPEIHYGQYLGVRIDPKWYHRKRVWDVAGEFPADAEGQTQPKGVRLFWLREDLTTSVCRYLNSGIPSIIGQDEHTQVVCGYLRSSQIDRDALARAGDIQSDRLLRAIESAQDKHGVVAFITQDDLKGPYRVLPLDDEYLTSLEEEPSGLFVPLPIGLWLPGHVAQRWGADLIATRAQEQLELLDEWAARWRISEDEKKSIKGCLTEIVSATQIATTPDEDGPFSVRSYALTGSDLKRSLMSRLREDIPGSRRHRDSSAIGLASLSKYTWTVELMKREQRPNRPAVVASIVLDGSASDRSEVDASVSELIIHLPGMLSSNTMGHAREDLRQWVPSRWTAYRSGRWDPLRNEYVSREAIHSRGLHAVVPVIGS